MLVIISEVKLDEDRQVRLSGVQRTIGVRARSVGKSEKREEPLLWIVCHVNTRHAIAQCRSQLPQRWKRHDATKIKCETNELTATTGMLKILCRREARQKL